MPDRKPCVGFIGLGLMGSAMVERMQDLKYPMNVLANRSRPHVDAAIARGAQEFFNGRELAAASELIMLCMDNSKSVESRMLGPEGVISGLKGNELVIDFGTSLPGSTLEIAALVKQAGASYIDAPLGRMPKHARIGKLNIMAGGSEADFNKAKLVFEDLGENIFHIGPVGTGHTLKLINNFYAMTCVTAMSEAFAMADKAGLSRQVLYDVMSAGSLRSEIMDLVKAHAVDREASIAFSIENGRKDISYYVEMAHSLGQDSAIAQGTKSSLDSAIAAGRGNDLMAEMVDFFARDTKVLS